MRAGESRIGVYAAAPRPRARRTVRALAAGARVQIASGTILIAPQGHSETQMPQPLQ
jgi:hypothetical protein